MENFSVTLEQDLQSQRTRESTQRIMGEALQKLASPLSTDAPSRTDAATSVDAILQKGADEAERRFVHGELRYAFIEGMAFGMTEMQRLAVDVVTK